MGELIFILLRIDYIFVAGLCLYLVFNEKNIDKDVLIGTGKQIFIGFAWACAYWAIFKLFVNQAFPTAIEFFISWAVILITSKIALYKIIKK